MPGECSPTTTNSLSLCATWETGDLREKYHHPLVGFNSRLDTMQAVVLSAKLARLDDWNKLRREAADRYVELLMRGVGFLRPWFSPATSTSGTYT